MVSPEPLMRIHLDEIPAGGVRLDLSVAPEEFELHDPDDAAGGAAYIAPLTFTLDLTRLHSDTVVRGVLRSRIAFACSRCLAARQAPVEVGFEILFACRRRGEKSAAAPRERELTAEDVGIIFFDGEVIDLRPALLEEAVAALPVKPLCREACLGLCPVCGQDLNESGCGCNPSEGHPGLAGLRRWGASDPDST